MTDHEGTFSAGRATWLARLGDLRNVVRQEVIARQLDAHISAPPARVLDVGAGQGTQALRLAARGYDVTAVEPDPDMQAALRRAVDDQPTAVRQRMTIHAAALGRLDHALGTQRFDVVMCHGVLMYLPSSRSAVAELASYVDADGLLSLAARSTTFLPWRPLLRGDWAAAEDAFAELDAAAEQSRDPQYVNEIGSPARADTVDGLTATCRAAGLDLEAWYGVRIASTDRDLSAPVPEPALLARIIELEMRLGRTDPYRQLGAMFHLLARRRA